MVKLNVICRSDTEYQRETKHDIQKIHRSINPQLHQFQKAREYQRALVSTKVDKIFAKPFVAALQGHSDAISVMAKCQNSLTKILSGSFDGEIRAWDTSERKTLFSLNAHSMQVKGVCSSLEGQRFLTSGDDKIINLYDYQNVLQSQQNYSEPMQKYMSKSILGNVDHMYKGDQFASAGQIVQIWNYNRTKAIHKFDWGSDTVLKVKFNPSDINLIAGTGIDRSVILYDIRGETPLQKTQLPNKCYGICWNPTEPVNLTVGCDDSNCYTYDIRNMSKIKNIHKDHIGAVLDIDYSPTGKEFVTASYDKTIRIFNVQEGRSREVYHLKRMQLLYSVLWSGDNQYIYSGSDDMNIRIWKAYASKPMGVIKKRQEIAMNYQEALKQKFANVKDVKRIKNYRHLPKYILNNRLKKQAQKESKFRKNKNMEINNPGMWQKPKPERETKVLGVIE